MTANTIIQLVCAVIQMFCFGWSLIILHKAKKIRENAFKMREEAKFYWERAMGEKSDEG